MRQLYVGVEMHYMYVNCTLECCERWCHILIKVMREHFSLTIPSSFSHCSLHHREGRRLSSSAKRVFIFLYEGPDWHSSKIQEMSEKDKKEVTVRA